MNEQKAILDNLRDGFDSISNAIEGIKNKKMNLVSTN